MAEERRRPGAPRSARQWAALSATLGECLAVYDEPIPALLNANAIPDAPPWGC